MKTLLAMDVGNTQTLLGLFNGKKLKKTWRILSRQKDLLGWSKKNPLPVDGIVISNVVPSLKSALLEMTKKHSPLWITPDMKMPIRLRVKNKKSVGSDRIVNVVSAYSKWKRDLLVIDFGTATTFDVITAHGDFLGGVIVPGLNLFHQSLSKCAQLPPVPIQKPARTIGKNTISAIQSGVFSGYVSLTEGLIQRLRKETRKKLKVIATGGLSTLIAPATPMIHRLEPNLTLEGLRILYDFRSF